MEKTAAIRLSTSGYAELKRVRCEFELHGHLLTLRGRVSSYYLKQLAQEVVRMLDGVDQVVNLIEVGERGESGRS